MVGIVNSWSIYASTPSSVSALTGSLPASSSTIFFSGPWSPTGIYVSTYTPAGTAAGSFAAGTLNDTSVTMAPYNLDGPTTTNATTTHTGGSPGKMWIIPAAIKMYTQTTLHNNFLAHTFGFGLEMVCSSWSSAHSGCNGSMATENTFQFNVIGRMVMGDNSGASASIMNVYAESTFADIVEGGAVGSTYFSENANSQEDSTSLYGIVGECVNSNSSSFFGGYAPTTGAYCTNGQLGVAPSGRGNVMFIAPQAGVPSGQPALYNAGFHGSWVLIMMTPIAYRIV